ncbi:MAG: squalene synthase HpnC [Planctomycetaceae bacterium]|nr:squalene synthase HpnC [Planctomycetaceae bacterium]
MDVISELDIWGPDCPTHPPLSLDEAEEYCRRLAETHYENFPVASWLLPRDLRQHFCNVYAYCRWADDLGDELDNSQRSLQLLEWWRGELQRCYAGEVQHPVFIALRTTVTEFDIPQTPFTDLIDAFVQDQTVTEYDTFDELRDYCRRSADPVGRILLRLCRVSRDETEAWSDSICTGLQLANFWQDVSRDFDIGRVYLPREDRDRFGYSPEMLRNRVTNEAFVQLMSYEVERARELLVAGMPLVHAMSGRMRVDIELFIRGGLQILSEVERIGFRVWDRRPVVRKRQLARMFMTTCTRHVWNSFASIGRG